MPFQKDFPKGSTGFTLGLQRIEQMHVNFFTKKTWVIVSYFKDENATEKDYSEGFEIDGLPDNADIEGWAQTQLMLPVGKDDKGADIASKFADAVVVSAKALPDPAAAVAMVSL